MKKPIIDIHSDRGLVLQAVRSVEYLRYHKPWQEIKYGTQAKDTGSSVTLDQPDREEGRR